jgi:hypothetical protein
MDAGDLDHSPDGTPGNNSCTFLCGLQEDMLGSEQPMYLMCNCPGREGNMHQVFLGLFNRLRDRYGNFGSFPFPDTDPSLSIPHDNQRAKVEPLPALHDFRHPVDKNNLVFQA